MQPEQPKMPTALRKNKRLRNVQTPDRSENRHMNASTVSVASPRIRKNSFSRQSTTSHVSLNSTTSSLRKLEMEHFNLELDFAYNDYIQSMAEFVIAKKKIKETEAIYMKSISHLSTEVQTLQSKCHIQKTRNNNINFLSKINSYQDVVEDYLKVIEREQKKNETGEILLELKRLLSRFNVLRCENIELPQSAEEMLKFKDTLENCLSTLEKINLDESKELENFADSTEEFSKICNETLVIKKMVEEEINELQSEVLNKCSNLFLHNEKGE